MRVAIIGQQAFGKAVLDAFIARGDTVVAVFCAPEKGRPDPLRLAGEEAGVPTHMFPKLTSPEALEALRAAEADIGVMAYVTQFVSQEFCAVPTHGTIQFHPSLLPLHRGASSMSWAIVLGRKETGFSIFRPSDGLDEGPVILQRTVRDRAGRHAGLVVFRPSVSAGRGRVAGNGGPGAGRQGRGHAAGRGGRDLRGHHRRGGIGDPLGEPRRPGLRPRPRLRPGTGSLDHP